MSSMITNIASPEASREPDSGIIENYKTRLQALGYSIAVRDYGAYLRYDLDIYDLFKLIKWQLIPYLWCILHLL